jgi:hypothetical protein
MADDNIELRSEKVRHIIGEIPSRIVRYGITIITVVILGLLAGAYFIPYPETVTAEMRLTDARHASLTVPYKYVNTVESGMTVSIELEGYDAETYGVTEATVTAVSRTPRQTAAGTVFTAQAAIGDGRYKTLGGMTGTASILVSSESVLQRIIRQITRRL